MPKVRALVPLRHPTTDEEFPADTVVDVAEEVASAWKAQGKITLIEDEERLAKAAATGNYSSVIGREDVGQVSAATSHPGPQAEEEDEDEDQPRSRRGRRG